MTRYLLVILLLGSVALSCAHGPCEQAGSAGRESAAAEVGVEPTPWTHLQFANDPEQFQFLIVADRTGGHRPGVFPEALRKAELLHPEFVMSVGDLIEGYSEDRAELEQQWDEFEGFLEGLDMPFFHVAGNHDFTNDVMAEVWRERFGRAYYHFVYRDVLFLCANSQDGEITRISPEQVDYFRQALEENSDARWTLLFLHKPLWVYDVEDAPGWAELEDLLAERDYTVFAGHFHVYRKHERRDRRYFVLSTTGGVNSLGGPDRGQFDHMVWVTMTDKGPQVANLLVDGIWDEDVFTERSAELVEQLGDLRATPHLFRPDGTLLTKAGFRLNNEENIPMRVTASAEEHPGLAEPWSLEAEVAPNSVSEFSVPLEVSEGEQSPLVLSVTTSFEPEDHRPLEYEHDFCLEVGALRLLPERASGLAVDGDLSDWPELPFEVEDTGSAGRASFGLSRDESMLYLGVRVEDDRVVAADPPAQVWHHDHLELRIDSRPFEQRTLIRTQWDLRTAIFLALFPVLEEESDQVWRRDNYPEEMAVSQSAFEGGYVMELAIPFEYLAERGGVEQLMGFSFNLTVVDRDEPEGEERSSSWQTGWHLEEAAVGAGGFVVG